MSISFSVAPGISRDWREKLKDYKLDGEKQYPLGYAEIYLHAHVTKNPYSFMNVE